VPFSKQPTMPHDVFISYSSKDKSAADAVCATLESRGIRCWIAPRDILPGADWGEAIINAIEASRLMLLVFSSNANESQQVRREIERAVNKSVVIVPLRIEDAPMSKSLEFFISAQHWFDALTPPLQAHLGPLAQMIGTILEQSESRTQNARDSLRLTAQTFGSDRPRSTVHRPSNIVLSRGQFIGFILCLGIAAVLVIGVAAKMFMDRRNAANATTPQGLDPKQASTLPHPPPKNEDIIPYNGPPLLAEAVTVRSDSAGTRGTRRTDISIETYAPAQTGLTTLNPLRLVWYASTSTSLKIRVTLYDPKRHRTVFQWESDGIVQGGIHLLDTTLPSSQLEKDATYTWFVSLTDDSVGPDNNAAKASLRAASPSDPSVSGHAFYDSVVTAVVALHEAQRAGDALRASVASQQLVALLASEGLGAPSTMAVWLDSVPPATRS
jgi:hypothetical protein